MPTRCNGQMDGQPDRQDDSYIVPKTMFAGVYKDKEKSWCKQKNSIHTYLYFLPISEKKETYAN